MQIQSFFHKYHQLAISQNRHSDGPALIILDTSKRMRAVLDVMRTLPVMLWEKEDIAEFIMSFIAYEEKAMIELGYGCLELVSDALGTEFAPDAEKATKEVSSFGMEIFDQLQRIRAYRNGYLFYSFHGWLGDDLVLSRLSVDRDPDKIRPPND